VVAASLVPLAASIRVVVEVSGSRHPIELAEELAVTDQLLGGRLSAAGTAALPGQLDEMLQVLRLGLGSRPFRHSGQHWAFPTPGDDGSQQRILVTPSPAQIEFPLALLGSELLALALDRGLSVVGREGDDAPMMRELWRQFEEAAGHAAARHARAALRSLRLPATVDGDVDPVVAQLAAEEEAWGMDVAIVRLPSELSPRQRVEVIELLATRVRPRLQGTDLPDELVASWSTPPSTDSEGAHP
jgi:alkanesulfonate monooxygenase SsuD/methylene tetrahydromethanopterin reductase-like flavin-dependent oxidoreductase (luciferase family)